jgi:hypothetical protein
MQPVPASISASLAAIAAAIALTASAPAAAQDVAGFRTPHFSTKHGVNKGRLPGLYPGRSFDRRSRHHHDGDRRHHRRDRDEVFWSGDAALGYAEADPRPRSFFDGHGRVDIIGGEPVYSYDRSYPYRHSSNAVLGAAELGYAARAERCATSWTWDERARSEVPVRICRR